MSPVRSVNVDRVTRTVQDTLADLRALDGSIFNVTIQVQFASVGGLTPQCSIIYGVIRAVYGTGFAMSEGPVVRNIRGTDTWSQHAYGNAIDVMVGEPNPLHREIAYFLDANRAELHVAHLLADPFFPSPLGDHYNHVHVDPYPQWGGTPPGHPV